MLINPGNPTGTLNIYLFVITCNNINEDDDDDDDDDDGDDNKISLFIPDIVLVLAHNQVSAFELSFHGVPLIKGCSLYQGVSYIGFLFAGVFFFPPFFDEFLLIPGCSLSRPSLNYIGCPLYRDSTTEVFVISEFNHKM